MSVRQSACSDIQWALNLIHYDCLPLMRHRHGTGQDTINLYNRLPQLRYDLMPRLCTGESFLIVTAWRMAGELLAALSFFPQPCLPHRVVLAKPPRNAAVVRRRYPLFSAVYRGQGRPPLSFPFPNLTSHRLSLGKPSCNRHRGSAESSRAAS